MIVKMLDDDCHVEKYGNCTSDVDYGKDDGDCVMVKIHNDDKCNKNSIITVNTIIIPPTY